ncbi:MAG: hypothetical protein AB7H77_04460 [Bdellovibrionales bacterium]
MTAIGRWPLTLLLCLFAAGLPVTGFASNINETIEAFDPAFLLQPKNRADYQLLAEGKSLGILEVYTWPRGSFVAAGGLLKYLGYTYYRDDGNGLLQVDFPDKTSLTLRFRQHEYIQSGRTEPLADDDFAFRDTDLFINIDFLNRAFPLGLSLDQAAGKLKLVQKDCGMPQTPMPSAPDDFPVPLAAPAIPVVVDDTAQRNPAAPDTEPPAQDVLRTAEASPPSAEPAKPPDGGEQELLILQPKIKKAPPGNLFIETVAVGDKLYLPLDDMMKLLEFDIKTDGAAGTAKGTFLSPDRNFSLDVKNRRLRVDDAGVALAEDSLLTRDGQIYVNAADFAKWFDIHCSLDRKLMMLAIDTKIELPVEARMTRHNLWNKLLMTQRPDNRNYTPVENPYRLVSVPFFDVNLSASYSNTGENKTAADYTVLGAGDLGYLTTNIYAAGSKQTPMDTVRVTAGRQDKKGALLGPLQATAFSLGDIDSPALALVTNSSLGRGFSVTSRDPGASDNFDTHTINGNAVPGWEVELYRNNVLLGFQRVDSSGRYEFLNQPLVYGNNNFRVVLYGPQGQIEDRTESIAIGSTMLKPGKMEYTVSVNQQSTSLITLNPSDGSAGTSSSPTGLRAVGQLRYGVADFLTMGAGMVQSKLADGYHHYASVTADTSFAGVYTESNFIKDLRNGWVGGAAAVTSFEDISLRLQHRQYHKFTSEAEPVPDSANFRKSVSRADMNGQFYIPCFEDFNLGLSALYETFIGEMPRTTYGSQFSKSILGVSFSNTLNYIHDGGKQFTGNFGMQTRVYDILFRADASYDVQPRFGMHNAAFTAQYRIDRDISAQTQVDRQLGDQTQSTLTQTVNLDLDSYRFSLSSQVNDKKDYMLGVSLVFSVAHDDVYNRWHARSDSLGNSGALAPRVFIDGNYNGRYDPGEQVLPDTRVRLNRVPAREKNGGDFIAPVAAYEAVDVDIDPATLKDPTLSPAIDGYRVTTRPGDVAKLDIPVISTSEIDGTVSIVDEKGTRWQIPEIIVELQDAGGNLIKRVKSEFDGFYVFDKVRPGEYLITVPQEALAPYHAELVEPLHIVIGKEADFHGGNDIVLKAAGPLPGKLARYEN